MLALARPVCVCVCPKSMFDDDEKEEDARASAHAGSTTSCYAFMAGRLWCFWIDCAKLVQQQARCFVQGERSADAIRVPIPMAATAHHTARCDANTSRESNFVIRYVCAHCTCREANSVLHRPRRLCPVTSRKKIDGQQACRTPELGTSTPSYATSERAQSGGEASSLYNFA